MAAQGWTADFSTSLMRQAEGFGVSSMAALREPENTMQAVRDPETIDELRVPRRGTTDYQAY
jgi:hypothetical protein